VPDPADTPTDLELAFDVSEVPLRALVTAGERLSGLLREVAKAYVGAEQDPARWLVHVEAGSVLLPLRAEPTSDEVAPSRLHEVGTIVADGLATLEAEAERPPYFNDRALEHARELAKVASDELPLAVRNGRARASLSVQLVANVEKVLGPDDVSHGTIEGALDALNVHGAAKRFHVYDAVSGLRVECRFTARVTLEDLRPAIGHRVAVSGTIRTRPDGRPVSIDADELHVFPPEDELPSPEAVFGLLRGYEVDE
jgi:hypothetical protein